MGITTGAIELELIERGIITILYDGLNDQIDVQNALWASRDVDFYAALGRPVQQLEVEHIAPENFYPGHTPSLIDAPIDRYPNVCAMAFNAVAQQSTDDHAEQYAISAAVEVMCKADCSSDKPDQAEDAIAAELVNSRIKRTAAAVHACLKTEAARSFGVVVPRIGNTPNLLVTEVFVRKEDRGRGPRWFWCGARFDFRVQAWVNY